MCTILYLYIFPGYLYQFLNFGISRFELKFVIEDVRDRKTNSSRIFQNLALHWTEVIVHYIREIYIKYYSMYNIANAPNYRHLHVLNTQN